MIKKDSVSFSEEEEGTLIVRAMDQKRINDQGIGMLGSM
jgi:hypothetical protein